MSWVLSLDNAILDAIQRLRCPLLDWFMPLYSRLGDHGMVCIALAALLLLFPKTRRAGEAMALALVLCLFSGNLFLKPSARRRAKRRYLLFYDSETKQKLLLHRKRCVLMGRKNRPEAEPTNRQIGWLHKAGLGPRLA